MRWASPEFYPDSLSSWAWNVIGTCSIPEFLCRPRRWLCPGYIPQERRPLPPFQGLLVLSALGLPTPHPAMPRSPTFPASQWWALSPGTQARGHRPGKQAQLQARPSSGSARGRLHASFSAPGDGTQRWPDVSARLLLFQGLPVTSGDGPCHYHQFLIQGTEAQKLHNPPITG